MTEKAKKRKRTPIFSGVLKYFPDALSEVARTSQAGNDQHHPDKPLHWDKPKSSDHADALARHLMDAGTIDDDGIRHSAKVAWRALAMLQIEIEKERQEDWEEDIIEKSKDDCMYPEDELICGTPMMEELYRLNQRREFLLDELPGSVDYDLAEIKREERMRIIGQNGNDGLHYDEANYMYDKISDYPESNITSTLYPGDIKITYDEV